MRTQKKRTRLKLKAVRFKVCTDEDLTVWTKGKNAGNGTLSM